MEDLVQTLGACVTSHIVHVGQVEAAVEVEHDALRREGLSAVGDVRVVGEILRAHVLKPLTTVEVEYQMFLLGR